VCIQQAINVLRERGEKSAWNFQGKIHLLEAEMLSSTGKKDKARVSFNAAISAAKSSKFVHEQGLACELAAFHCLRYGDNDRALHLFQQAQDCYTKWGSEVKVESIKQQIKNINAEAP